MMRRPITLAEQLDAEDAKLVVLARAAMARAEAGAGAAVRELIPVLRDTGLAMLVWALAVAGALAFGQLS
ncbi:hypothetical protein GR254_02330 [Mycobacterium tuberculosis]|nr:hypothetical protein [Mycobacterium tuberculosis]